MMQFPILPIAFVLAGSLIIADDGPDEAKVIQKIELLGGKVVRDEALPGHPVTGIDFQEISRFGEGYLGLLKSFENLRILNLRKTRITDVGLKEVGKLKSLTNLQLTFLPITDVGLKELSELTNLTDGPSRGCWPVIDRLSASRSSPLAYRAFARTGPIASNLSANV